MLHPRHKWVRGTLVTTGLACLGLLIASAPARATTLRKMDLPELVSSADRVVYARAISNTTYWDETQTQIYTDTAFEVLSEAKGSGPAVVIVNMLGGRIDPIEMRADGTPEFLEGDEVVLFTLNRPDGMSNLVGFSQGVMRVEQEENTGDKIAVSTVPVGVEYLSSGLQPTPVRPSLLRTKLTMLLDDVRQIVAGTREPGPSIATAPETDPVAEENP
jgi:hypothetical protein